MHMSCRYSNNTIWRMGEKSFIRLFYIIGKCFAFPMIQKSPPGRIALRRRGIILLKQSAAGGESCKAGFFFTRIVALQATNCER